MHTGKLHPKNVGPYLVLEKTGPVTYKIQEAEGARESIMHVDKLYPFPPEEGQVMVSGSLLKFHMLMLLASA